MKMYDDGSHVISLREMVYNKIKDNILNLVYPPGYILGEQKLSEEFGVSRTPVREAIVQLELDGLVKSTPNKGSVVTGLSRKDINDIYLVRMRIEGLAARLAAENITEDELLRLKEVVELEEFHTNKHNTGRVLEFDSRFHDIIFKASKSKMMIQMLSMFHDYIRRARHSSLSSDQRAHNALIEHKAILEAIEARDPDKAEELTVAHIRNARESMLKTYTE